MKSLHTHPLQGLRFRSALLFVFTAFLVFASAALAAEVGEGAGENRETMFSLLKKGGPVMIPLGIASVLAIALAMERFISLSKERVLPEAFTVGFGKAWDSDKTGEAAEEFCQESDGAAVHVFQAGIQWRGQGHEAVGKAIEDAGSREAEKLKRSVRPLSVIAGICPLLGLLGTVYGMIDAFQKTASSGGAAKTADLANGIYQALVSTAAGLTIAIPVLLLYQWLSTRADRAIDHIDEVGTNFVVQHALEKTRPRKKTRTRPANTGSADPVKTVSKKTESGKQP